MAGGLWMVRMLSQYFRHAEFAEGPFYVIVEILNCDLLMNYTFAYEIHDFLR